MLGTIEDGTFFGARALVFDDAVHNFKRLRSSANDRFIDVPVEIVWNRTTVADKRYSREEENAGCELENAEQSVESIARAEAENPACPPPRTWGLSADYLQMIANRWRSVVGHFELVLKGPGRWGTASCKLTHYLAFGYVFEPQPHRLRYTIEHKYQPKNKCAGSLRGESSA